MAIKTHNRSSAYCRRSVLVVARRKTDHFAVTSSMKQRSVWFAAMIRTHSLRSRNCGSSGQHIAFEHLLNVRQTLGESTEEKKGELVVAFEITGGPIAELVAVDCKGRFRVHDSITAWTCDLKPVLNGAGVIYYIANETVYAFSGKTRYLGFVSCSGVPDVRWIDGAGHVPMLQRTWIRH